MQQIQGTKSPVLQWVSIGVILLIIAGGIAYYLLSAKSPTGATQQASNPSTTQQTTATNAQNTVTLTSTGFSPATLTIKTGQTVTWINQSGQLAVLDSNPHPIHTDYPPLNLGNFANGASLSLTFPKPGTYGYHDHLNPGETGTIIVK